MNYRLKPSTTRSLYTSDLSYLYISIYFSCDIVAYILLYYMKNKSKIEFFCDWQWKGSRKLVLLLIVPMLHLIRIVKSSRALTTLRTSFQFLVWWYWGCSAKTYLHDAATVRHSRSIIVLLVILLSVNSNSIFLGFFWKISCHFRKQFHADTSKEKKKEIWKSNYDFKIP